MTHQILPQHFLDILIRLKLIYFHRFRNLLSHQEKNKKIFPPLLESSVFEHPLNATKFWHSLRVRIKLTPPPKKTLWIPRGQQVWAKYNPLDDEQEMRLNQFPSQILRLNVPDKIPGREADVSSNEPFLAFTQ